jgi:hypothetical protein
MHHRQPAAGKLGDADKLRCGSPSGCFAPPNRDATDCCRHRNGLLRCRLSKRRGIAVRSTTLSTVLLLTLAGCTVVRPVHLYPTGDSSGTPGVAQGQIVGHGQGHGTAELTMPDGETMQGEYSIVFGGAVGFGNIFGTLYGSGGMASGSAMTTSYSISGEGQGSASLVGNRGTIMQCEFVNANMTGHGYGACRTAKGILYRMIY